MKYLHAFFVTSVLRGIFAVFTCQHTPVFRDRAGFLVFGKSAYQKSKHGKEKRWGEKTVCMICLLDYLNAYLLGFPKPDDSGFKYFIYVYDLGTRFLSSLFPLVTSFPGVLGRNLSVSDIFYFYPKPWGDDPI